MDHSVAHDLGKEKAKQVTTLALDSYAQKFAEYQPRADWVADDRAKISFKVKGMNLDGVVQVKESSISLELDVPFLLRPFKGVAIGIIEREIKLWMAKAKAGEI